LKERKNPDASIRAFLDAFPLVQDKENNKYHLIVKSHHGSDEELDELKNVTQHDPRIHLLIDVLSNEDHYDLQHRADCYVSLHRSEGYGMNLLEEMGNGIPVIATNYSGNVAFFPPLEKLFGTCYFPVPYKLIELQESYGPYARGNNWADPDHNFTANAMREVVKHNCKENFGKEASELTMSVFGREAVGRKLKKELGELQPLIIEKERKMTKILL
jgi:glycosyltransferase involved in cell wall biosynthesis